MPSYFSYTLPGAATAPAPAPTGGDLVPVPDHCADGLSVLLEQYKESPLLRGYICALLSPLDDLETDVLDLANLLSIDGAAGVHLDLIGAILAYPRNGASDVDYRVRLKTEALVNRSEGKHEELLEIAFLFTGLSKTSGGLPSGLVRIYDGTANFVVQINAEIAEPFLLEDFLDRAAAAGVFTQVIYLTQADPADVFAFPETAYATPEIGSAAGLGSVYTTTGGHLAGVAT